MNQKLIKNIAIIIVLMAQSSLFAMQEQEVFQKQRVSAPRSSLFSSIQDQETLGSNSYVKASSKQFIEDALTTLCREKFEAIVNNVEIAQAARVFFKLPTQLLLQKSNNIRILLERLFSSKELLFSEEEKFLFRVSTQGHNLYFLVYKAALCQMSQIDRLQLIHILIAAYELIYASSIIKAIKACFAGDLKSLKELPLGEINHALIVDAQCNVGVMMVQSSEIEFSDTFLEYMYSHFVDCSSINLTNVDGNSLLMIAAGKKHTVILQAMLKRSDLALNAQNNDEDTAFSIAVNKNFIDGVRLFLEREDLDQSLGQIFSPVTMAEFYGFDDMVELLNSSSPYLLDEALFKQKLNIDSDSDSDMDICSTQDE